MAYTDSGYSFVYGHYTDELGFDQYDFRLGTDMVLMDYDEAGTPIGIKGFPGFSEEVIKGFNRMKKSITMLY